MELRFWTTEGRLEYHCSHLNSLCEHVFKLNEDEEEAYSTFLANAISMPFLRAASRGFYEDEENNIRDVEVVKLTKGLMFDYRLLLAKICLLGEFNNLLEAFKFVCSNDNLTMEVVTCFTIQKELQK